jgi:hypothetical protein
VGDNRRISRPTRTVVAVAAVLAQVALLFVYWFAPAMIAGPPWTYAFLLAWIVEFVAALVLARRRPLAAPLVPLISLVLGVLALMIGEPALGWTR